jgi:hypothetical protein
LTVARYGFEPGTQWLQLYRKLLSFKTVWWMCRILHRSLWTISVKWHIFWTFTMSCFLITKTKFRKLTLLHSSSKSMKPTLLGPSDGANLKQIAFTLLPDDVEPSFRHVFNKRGGGVMENFQNMCQFNNTPSSQNLGWQFHSFDKSREQQLNTQKLDEIWARLWKWTGHCLGTTWKWTAHCLGTTLEVNRTLFGHDLEVNSTLFGHDLGSEQDTVWARLWKWTGHCLGTTSEVNRTLFGHDLGSEQDTERSWSKFQYL